MRVLAAAQIRWIAEQIDRMRRDCVWEEATLGPIYLLRIGVTTTANSEPFSINVWPKSKVEIFGLRGFGPVEIQKIGDVEFDESKPLRSFSREPYVPLEAGVFDPIAGKRLQFVGTAEAREIDLFLVGQFLPDDVEQLTA
jgi:hypothetical protein